MSDANEPLGAVTNLPDALVHYRQRHPIPGEQVRVTVAGFAEGRSVPDTRWQAVVLAAVLVPATVAVIAGVSFFLVAVAAMVVTLVALIVVSSRLTGGGRMVGAFLSDHRFVAVASAGGRAVDVVAERPAAEVDRATVEVVESRWLIFTTVVIRARLGGPAGFVFAVDQAGTDPSVLGTVLAEAGLRVTVAA